MAAVKCCVSTLCLRFACRSTAEIKYWHSFFLFPVYLKGYISLISLTYYNNIDPDETVDICNTLRQRAADGQTIFYDIYTEDEKAADPDKADTGLFYFKGNPGAKFSICNAGGAFAYVGAMQDSFPHALEPYSGVVPVGRRQRSG